MYQNMDRSIDEYSFTPFEDDSEGQNLKVEHLDTSFSQFGVQH